MLKILFRKRASAVPLNLITSEFMLIFRISSIKIRLYYQISILHDVRNICSTSQQARGEITYNNIFKNIVKHEYEKHQAKEFCKK